MTAPPLTQRRRATALVSTALLVPALLSACSSAPDGPTPVGTDAAPASSEAARVGQCVRDAGYDVEDDDFSTPGSYRQPAGLSADELDAYAETVADCASGTSLAPPSRPGGGQGADRQLLDLAACLRDAGYPDAEDPVDGVWRPDPDHQGDPAYDEATATCAAEVGLKS